MRELLRHLITDLEQGRECLLCQVVQTRGSTPQKAGAVMLVRPDGHQVGTLGGGCVEAEVKQKAIRQLGEPGAALHTFVLDHDQAWADGLICGGKMVILTECLGNSQPVGYYGAYLDLLEAGRGLTEVIAVDAAPLVAGARALFDADGRCVAAWPEGVASWSSVAAPAPLSERPRPGVRAGVAYVSRLPRVRLVIVGAGHVGLAVAELAARVDFDIWVVDDRAQYASPERFPMARRRIVGPIDDVLRSLEIDEHTYALIVTRGHGHDQEALSLLAPTPASYVGLIGSRRKIRLIFEELRDQGITPEALARVAAPVGLDIGSESLTEIAISIVAELIARRNLGPGAVTPRGWVDPTSHGLCPSDTRIKTIPI